MMLRLFSLRKKYFGKLLKICVKTGLFNCYIYEQIKIGRSSRGERKRLASREGQEFSK